MESQRGADEDSLPISLTSFVGREREVARVMTLLATTRLLTLTGAGGVGKTRLALAVAARVASGYPDGARWAELAPLVDPALVPQTVADALGVREQPGRPVLTTLLATLKPRRLLLVLDNCEHLLDACAALADALLHRCPELRILATSREPLGIAGETAWRVPSLALPAEGQMPASPQETTEVEAMALFVERARAVRPDFTLTAGNVTAVAELCRRLDGIPLAIELAAARVRALPAEQLVQRLDDRFRLLTGGSRTALPRQQTLQATIDWSYELLAEPERALLRRLSVFAGGFALGAAEAVCAGDGVETWRVVDLLMRLVDKSLVQMDEGNAGEARYRLQETVRQYAQERLTEVGEVEAARGRHAAWCLALAEDAEVRLFEAQQLAWLERLAAEYDNLRAALAWCARADPATGLRLAGALWRFWQLQGHAREGAGWLEQLLARAGGRDAARAKALLGVGILLRNRGDLTAARAALEEGLATAREARDDRLVAWMLHDLGIVLYLLGELTAAQTLAEERLALARSPGESDGLGDDPILLGGIVAAEGDLRRATALLEASLARRRAAGERQRLVTALTMLAEVAALRGEAARAGALLDEAGAVLEALGWPHVAAMYWACRGDVARDDGDLGGAVACYERGLALAPAAEGGKGGPLLAGILAGLGTVTYLQDEHARAVTLLGEALVVARAGGLRRIAGQALWALGLLAHAGGEPARATELLRESLGLRRAIGERLGIVVCLEGLAAVAGQGEADRAARLLGVAEVLREAMGAPLLPAWRPAREATLWALRATLGDRRLAAATAAGRAMTLEQAVSVALGTAPTSQSTWPTVPRPSGSAADSPLTGRELEVARLIAVGMTNRQIAAELSISGRTVDRHVANILGKLDLAARTQIAAWVVQR